MREIKFRVFNKTKGKMSEPFTIEDLLRVEVPLLSGSSMTDEIIWIEYTGLKDSEVVEEYFGDIIEENDGTRRIVEDGMSAVLFVTGKHSNKRDIKHFWDLLPHRVIGNIYENPE